MNEKPYALKIVSKKEGESCRIRKSVMMSDIERNGFKYVAALLSGMADVSTNPAMRERRVKMMADYQFGKGAGDALFEGDLRFVLSRTKRIRQVYSGDDRLVTLRASDGFFTLGIKGAERIHKHFPAPALRIVIVDEAVPFVSQGKTAFAKHIAAVDPALRAGDEAIITDKDDNLIATGQLLLSPQEILAIGQGPGVNVRSGILKEGKE